MKAETKTAAEDLAILRARSGDGDVFATGALDAAARLARHPNRGGWGDCEQARADYRNYVHSDIRASADEMADAMQRDRKSAPGTERGE